MFDVIVRNVLAYDGSGAEPFEADLAIAEGRLAAVGSVGGSATREIDADGLAAAPGFIDVHTHDDFAALLHADMAFKVLGGVTTCIVGNCGMGAAPWQQASALARVFHPSGQLPAYLGHRGYLEHLAAHPPSVNIGALAGHGTLRMAAMEHAAAAPSGAELERMKSLLHEGLEAGVFGLSTGLIYEPGRHAELDEIAELAGEMRGSGGLYATHMRDEAAGLVASVEEALEVGRRAGVAVQISHHKAMGRSNWGLVRESLERIDRARAAGATVHADQYPYTAGSTILAAVLDNAMLGESHASIVTAADVVVASCKERPEWEGRSLESLKDAADEDSVATARRILAEAPGATVVLHTLSEDDVRRVMRHPSTMIGSDGIPTLEANPHPRLYGSFARVLGRYVRESGTLALPDAVRRMTGLSADAFGLRERGYLRPGCFADVVLFDPDSILDRGTFERPKATPDGIHHVFVNGVEVVGRAGHTGARSGHALRRAAPDLVAGA